jgi:hypothetical protein
VDHTSVDDPRTRDPWACEDAFEEDHDMVVVGTLIAESLRVGAILDSLSLTVTKIARADVGDVDADQPRTWTFLEFEISDEELAGLLTALERGLESRGGWYCDARSDAETLVVFAGRTFRYPHGDASGRERAAEYARSVGVPEAQLDWPT